MGQTRFGATPFTQGWLPGAVGLATPMNGLASNFEFIAAIEVSGWSTGATIVLAALAGGLVSRWIGRSGRAGVSREALIHHPPECFIWRGSVELRAEVMWWDVSVEPSEFSARILGSSFGAKGQPWWGALDVPQRAELLDRWQAVLKQGKTAFEHQFRLQRADADLWIRENVSIAPLGGSRFQISGLATNITDLREPELHLQSDGREQREPASRVGRMPWRAHVTQNGAGQMAWTWFIPDSELYRRIRTEDSSTPRMPWDRALVPEFGEMEIRGRSAMLKGLPSYEQEFRFVREGMVLWLHEHVSVRSTGPHSWVLEGVTVDITAQREVEESKRVSEAQLQRLTDASDFLVWHARVFEAQDGQLQWVLKVPSSGLYRRIFGRNPIEPVGLPWQEIVASETCEEMRVRATSFIKSGAEHYEQEICATQAGQLFWLHEQATIRRVAPGEWQLVGIVRDVTTRHQAEEARQTSERALREILERADCMLWRATVTRHGSSLKWSHFDLPASRLCAELLGSDPKSRSDQLWDLVDAPDLAEMNVRSSQALLTGKTGYEQQFRANRDGRLFWLHERVSIQPVGPDEWRLVGVVTDITRRHEALEAQRASEARLEELLRRVECMIWHAHVTQKADGGLAWQVYVPRSQLHRRIFGRDPDGLGFPWQQLGVPQEAEMLERSRDAILSGRPGYEQVFQIPNADGGMWVTEQVTISQRGPSQWELVGVMTDVTARHEAEVARRTTEAQLQKILEFAECMVWEAVIAEMPDGEMNWKFYTTSSVLYRRIFGDKNEELRLRWTKLNVPELQEMQQRSQRAIQENASGYQQEFRVILPDGVIWLREAVTISPLESKKWRLVGVITDITAQREAQEAQKISEAQVEQMLATVDCLLWQARVFEVSPGKLHWVMFIPPSRLYREIFGKDPGQPARLDWPNVVDEATITEISERCEKTILSGANGYEQEFQAQRNGRIFWLHEQVSIAPLGPGEWKLVGVMTDMTARREAENAMRASELRYRTLYQHIPMAILEADFTPIASWLEDLRAAGVTDLASRLEVEPAEMLRAARLLRFTDCNDTAMTMLRAKSKSEFRHRRGALSTGQSMRTMKAVLGAIWEGRNALESEFELRDFDGQLHDMHLRWWMEMKDGRLDLSQSVMVLVDVTKLKQAEAALAAEKERLAVTLWAMAEGVITTDVEGIVQFINPAAAALTQCDADMAIGRSVSEICRFENDRTGEKIEVPVTRVALGDTISELPSRTKLVGARGIDRLVDGCCAPIHSSNSAVIGTVLVFRDVTEHERLEQELVRATRLESVGVLAGGIAHDFNNILTVILGNVALAALDLDGASAAARSLQEAEKATLRARDLTQQLLTFAKGGEPVRAAVQLDAVVREITTFTLHGSNVRPLFQVNDDLWPANADKGQIGRVVQNLVINAVQAMPEGGTITITLTNERVDGMSRPALPPGDYVQIAISDTGTGIKPDHLPRIFDPYFTTKQMGSGLGLAAVYSIVNKHRGTIDVDSRVGIGTTFRIWLPASHVSVVLEEGEEIQDSKITMKGRVLFMDDEEPIRQLAMFLLRRFGFEVECVADGAEVVKKYREALSTQTPFVLVIVDLTVPGGMGGREAVAQLRAMDPNVKAIVSSGYSSDPVLANYREHGFSGVAAKPYEVADLARVLRAVLAGTPGVR